MPTLTLTDFVARWQASTRTERSAAQEHFLDLCAVFGQPTPAQVDGTGEFYTFEKGVAKTGGGKGFADVWRRGYWGWEYKGSHKDLPAAYKQLLQYREDLENPPLLIVSDLKTFEIHTNFTNTAKSTYSFTLQDLLKSEPTATSALPPLEVLRAVFTDPTRLRPQKTTTEVTESAAAEFAKLASSLRAASVDPVRAAHFLMRLLFCLFAEDIGLLPPRLFTELVESNRTRPLRFKIRLQALFAAMATGGDYGNDDIAHFDGGLFNDDSVLDLSEADLTILARACSLDWASVEPAIFGTLFERSLDPSKRSQLGAHYTSKDDILLIIEPVLMAPLRRRWEEIQVQADALTTKREEATGAARTKLHQALQKLLIDFATEIAAVRVLDPACGSGNFLYVALKQLLDLEKQVVLYAATHGVGAFFPQVNPQQLYGIEINPYAHELASVVVWIGYIQWLHDNGFGVPASPILKPLHNIEQKDAILAYDTEGRAIEPEWPPADVILGNPPFLGGNRIRQGLGDSYVENLFALYESRLPAFSDLVCYWFERARVQIAEGPTRRVGLIATQGIRGGVNRRVLERIKETGDIFMAWSDRPWILDGAAVHVSIVGFDDGAEQERTLNGATATVINANLTTSYDLTQARRLPENLNLCFIGTKRAGAFDIDNSTAQIMLTAPLNPNGRPNSDVLFPWVTAHSLVQRHEDKWIIYFAEMTEEESALYEQPFEYLRQHVYAERQKNNEERARLKWWQHRRPATEMRNATKSLSRYLATPRHAKHRLFAWVPPQALPDDGLYVFARNDDYFFGVLQAKPHELWARATGTQVREAETGFRYTPTSTFDTYPFPWPPRHERIDDPRVQAIGKAAADLDAKRNAWLNPSGASESELKQRTLTNLYNQYPTWLAQAHQRLDAAVLAAYGWPANLTNDEILRRLLELNHQRTITTQPSEASIEK